MPLALAVVASGPASKGGSGGSRSVEVAPVVWLERLGQRRPALRRGEAGAAAPGSFGALPRLGGCASGRAWPGCAGLDRSDAVKSCP
jgi:hypothetical protein